MRRRSFIQCQPLETVCTPRVSSLRVSLSTRCGEFVLLRKRFNTEDTESTEEELRIGAPLRKAILEAPKCREFDFSANLSACWHRLPPPQSSATLLDRCHPMIKRGHFTSKEVWWATLKANQPQRLPGATGTCRIGVPGIFVCKSRWSRAAPSVVITCLRERNTSLPF